MSSIVDSDNFNITDIDRISDGIVCLNIYSYSSSVSQINTKLQPIFNPEYQADRTIWFKAYLPSQGIELLEAQRGLVNELRNKSTLYVFSGCPGSLFEVTNADIQIENISNFSRKYLYVELKEVWTDGSVGKFW